MTESGFVPRQLRDRVGLHDRIRLRDRLAELPAEANLIYVGRRAFNSKTANYDSGRIIII